MITIATIIIIIICHLSGAYLQIMEWGGGGGGGHVQIGTFFVS